MSGTLTSEVLVAIDALLDAGLEIVYISANGGMPSVQVFGEAPLTGVILDACREAGADRIELADRMHFELASVIAAWPNGATLRVWG